MLTQLRIDNLLVIESADLQLKPGLNVFTGETGAGKTVLVHALELILGAKPRSRIVRPGAEGAYVEATFELDDRSRRDSELLQALDQEELSEPELVLARKVQATGRTRAYVNGRGASAELLKAVGVRLLSLCSQHQHRTLTSPTQQLAVVDRFAGSELSEELQCYRGFYQRYQELEAELEELRELSLRSDNEIDRIVFEMEEIEKVSPSVEEEQRLTVQRDRLRHLEALRISAFEALEALSDEDHGALAAVARAVTQLDKTAGVDSDLDTLRSRSEVLLHELQDIGSELRAFGGELEISDESLDETEARLAAFDALKRKHKGTLEQVLARLRSLGEERGRLENAKGSTDEAEKALDQISQHLETSALRLTELRTMGGKSLEQQIDGELNALGMRGTSFSISVESTDGERFGSSGRDSVSFEIAANAGVPAGPIAAVASGGELSRIMLAIMSAVDGRGDGGTFVFDEIDAGIGGNTANAVAARLRKLGQQESGQIICITHLPQVASVADLHFSISKTQKGGLATTKVAVLADQRRVDELCRMLGADKTDGGARRHANELLAA